MDSPARRFDWLLLIEVTLVLLLLGLGILLYFRPAAEGFLAPRWWHAVVLGALFFSAVALGARRRRLRARAALHAGLATERAADREPDRE